MVQGRLPENSPNNVFFFFFITLFYSLQTVSGCLSTVLFQRKLLSQVSEGSIIIPGGSTIFQGGPTFSRVVVVQMLFSIETHITCDFLRGGGVGPPSSPLNPHMSEIFGMAMGFP